MHDAQEGVGEGHACHSGGVGHLLARERIRFAGAGAVAGPGQIFEDRLQAPDRQTVGVIRGHHGGVGLQGVGDGVDAGSARKPQRRVHHHVRVHDGHLWHQFVVGERIFDAAPLVRNNGEGRYLAAGAGRGRHCDHVGFDAHFGERVDAFPDVHKAHRHVHKVRFRVFVEHPHDLRRVHRGAASDCYYHVGAELRHLGGALPGAGQSRVRRHV